MAEHPSVAKNDHSDQSVSNVPAPVLANVGDIVVQEECAVRAVRVPMPQIVRDNMEMWFIQLEHWFKVVGITGDGQKFSTVVSALDAKLLQQVYTVVRDPPPSNRYQAIVDAIIHNFADSEQQRIQQLISGIQLGDRKPSHLLNDLRRVSGDVKDEKLLKGLWMKRLPVEVQVCLETVTAPLNKLAELADTVMETFRVGSEANVSVASVLPVNIRSTSEDPIKILTQEVRKIASELSSLKSQLRRQSRSRSQTTNRSSTSRQRSSTPHNSSRHSSTSAAEDGDDMCWYHREYADNARKCKSPCAWIPKN